MTIDDYQKEVAATSNYPQVGKNLNYTIVGLASKTGELLDKWHKRLHGAVNDDDVEKAISKDLGFIMWFCAAVASELDMSLESIVKGNVEILKEVTSEKNV